MIQITGYTIIAELYESQRTLICRARQDCDQTPVILKILKSEYPTAEELARYNQEYVITSRFNTPEVIRPYRLEPYKHAVLICFEDIGGESLKSLLQTRAFSLTDILSLAARTAEVLDVIHAARVIHKDLNPANIVYNPATNRLQVIDFGLATVLSRENPMVRNPKALEGTLAYISPEQTGRMNRALDYRTDFYSLGATLYELFTGQPPFVSADPLELVYCHLAKMPIPPYELSQTPSVAKKIGFTVPQVLSDIVLKLLAKNAEERYQTGRGLQADLETCLQQIQAQGHIDPFPLGQADQSGRFQIPQKFYGQEQALAVLTAAFERVAAPERGGPEVVLITGEAGVGKSALAQELHKPIIARRGYFLTGKYDQYQRNIPYYGLSQALNVWCQDLLTESEETLQTWRTKILTVVASNGQVLIEVIPNLALVIGPQPTVAQVGPQENQNRFNWVFQNFIRAISQANHPLVLFLDDLHWADGASLNLLNVLLGDAEIRHLLIIAAYRDNEVDAAHPLSLILEDIKKKPVAMTTLAVSNLTPADMTALIADCLACPSADAAPLSAVVYRKTQGNAFFVIEFLKSLYAEGLLTFVNPSQSSLVNGGSQGGWRWNVQQIQAKNITDNVVELMADTIGELAPEHQQVLQLASCIGNRFDLGTLALICQRSPAEVCANLWTALQEGLVVPLDDCYRWVSLTEGDESGQSLFMFQHDRVQQAAYSLMAEAERKTMHFQIGRLLLQDMPVVERETRIFEIVNHLNQGREFLTTETERVRVAELNLFAGRKARISTAYGPAREYLRVGRELVSDAGWQTRHALLHSLYTEAIIVAYLAADYAEVEQLGQVMLDHATTALDTATVYEMKVLSRLAQQQMMAAIQMGLEGLRRFGVVLPEQPTFPRMIFESLKTKLLVRGGHPFRPRPFEEIVQAPAMTDPHQLALIHLLLTTAHPAYSASPMLLAVIGFQTVQRCLMYGNLPFPYLLYGLMSVAFLGDIDLGYRFGQLALRLAHQDAHRDDLCKVAMGYYYTIVHWKEPVRNQLAILPTIPLIGLETGDQAYACTAASNVCALLVFVGEPLEGVAQQQRAAITLIQSLNQPFAGNYAQVWCQFVQNLRGNAPDVHLLSGEFFNETDHLPQLQQANHRTALFAYYLAKTLLSYYWEEYAAAVKWVALSTEYQESIAGQFAFAQNRLYMSLAMLAHYPEASRREQRRYRRLVRANQKKMRQWATHTPENFRHKYDLVAAEWYRVMGQETRAQDAYQQAIDGAKQHGFLHEEALANELAGRYYLSKGRTSIARMYLREARYGYVRWGAAAKVAQLESRYPDLLRERVSSAAEKIMTSGSAVLKSLDLESVLKASQAIAGEIVSERLLTMLMHIVLENAGAQRGMLLLQDNQRWQIEAASQPDAPATLLSRPVPLDAADDILPIAVVQYVIHTRESLVLNNACAESRFSQNTYIRRTQPKSVACVPLLHQGNLTGILYLENNLTTGAFTPERLAVLSLLASQAAISLENARIYKQLLQLKKAIETMQLGMTITDLEGAILYANPAQAEMHGYHVSELLGRNIQLLRSSSSQTPFTLDELTQWKGLVRESVNLRKDGTLFPVWLTSDVVRDAEGAPFALITSCEDITERKQAEEELQQHRHHLEKLVKQRTAELVTINAELQQEVTERQKVEAELRESQHQLQDSYRREQERHQLSETLREAAKIVSGTLEQQKVVLLILDLLEKVVSYQYANVLLYHNDSLTRIVWRSTQGDSFAPLTIPAARYPLNAVVLQTKRPIVLPDVRADSRWQPSQDTADIRSFLNTPLLVQDQPIGLLCVGRHDDIPYTEDDAQTVFAFATQVAIALENARLVEQTQATLHELEKTLDDLRKTQKQLVESEKMAALGQLVAGIAHEINTPLGAIRASIANLANGIHDTIRQLPQVFQELTPEQQPLFFALVERALREKNPLTSREERALRRSLRHTLGTLNIAEADDLADMLVDMGIYDEITPFVPLLQTDQRRAILSAAYNLAGQHRQSQNMAISVERMSRIVFALKTYVHYTPTTELIEAKITEGIDVILTLYHNQLKHGIEIIKYYADVPAIRCYPDELNQVWTNLIHNAIQAMQGKGRLEIAVSPSPTPSHQGRGTDSPLPLREGMGEGGILVQITDSGCGIPEAIKDRIFEPFFTTKPAGEGSGLGLDICKKIIDKHQGKIEFASQPGKTTFSVWLPRLLPETDNNVDKKY